MSHLLWQEITPLLEAYKEHAPKMRAIDSLGDGRDHEDVRKRDGSIIRGRGKAVEGTVGSGSPLGKRMRSGQYAQEGAGDPTRMTPESWRLPDTTPTTDGSRAGQIGDEETIRVRDALNKAPRIGLVPGLTVTNELRRSTRLAGKCTPAPNGAKTRVDSTAELRSGGQQQVNGHAPAFETCHPDVGEHTLEAGRVQGGLHAQLRNSGPLLPVMGVDPATNAGDFQELLVNHNLGCFFNVVSAVVICRLGVFRDGTTNLTPQADIFLQNADNLAKNMRSGQPRRMKVGLQ